ncbi:hypothetical protein ALQ05_101908 [Pseudomonas amygdali pv. mori]|uniref:Uncharacterized protein n=1 Tax=Pseudomonas amygdali pv. mori TaxID=34065 RepID=A0A3M5J954_PSEA0|nr:hypothetical protein ALQ05_101908 [Pseudomonas amygdali pv. mori]RMT19927.1 hypothetical protein ALP52_102346 [Pseudomonas amygdali pv. mori]
MDLCSAELATQSVVKFILTLEREEREACGENTIVIPFWTLLSESRSAPTCSALNTRYF